MIQSLSSGLLDYFRLFKLLFMIQSSVAIKPGGPLNLEVSILLREKFSLIKQNCVQIAFIITSQVIHRPIHLACYNGLALSV